MGKHLVLVGGGHAHMTALRNIDRFYRRGHRVTLVSPSPYHYYSGMGPGMLGGIYEPREVRFHIRKMAEKHGAEFIRDAAVRVDMARRSIILGSGATVPFDVASFNTGSNVPPELLTKADERVFPVKPIINLYRARIMLLRESERRPLEIIVLGGGPAGVEISANLHRLLRCNNRQAGITLIGGNRILAKAPERVRRLALDSLTGNGIRVREGVYGKALGLGLATLSDGSCLNYDFAFIATGVRPSTLFAESGLPTGDNGGLLVNSCLQSIDHPELFGGGDCIALETNPLAKVGVYAVRQNPVLFHNLMAALEGRELQQFDPGGAYMLIMNMGDGTGILWKKSLVFNSRIPFLLKDFVDRRFMKKFQLSGEREELFDGTSPD
jgi:NADH dehydrogenase FAD-containing subunit